MLSIVILGALGKAFYELAEKYKRPLWTHTILAILVFFIGQFIFGIGLGFYYVQTAQFDKLDEMGEGSFGINILGMIVGLVSSLIYYFILDSYWKRNALKANNNNVGLLDDIIRKD